MTNHPKRGSVTDTVPVWLGHPVVVVLYGLLFLSNAWVFVDEIATGSRGYVLLWRGAVFLLMTWLLWLTANVCRRRWASRV